VSVSFCNLVEMCGGHRAIRDVLYGCHRCRPAAACSSSETTLGLKKSKSLVRIPAWLMRGQNASDVRLRGLIRAAGRNKQRVDLPRYGISSRFVDRSM
jgi:hypothetical protein